MCSSTLQKWNICWSSGNHYRRRFHNENSCRWWELEKKKLIYYSNEKSKNRWFSDGKRVKLQIWDTGGQERFRTITQSYYRSANGIVLCYDITCKQSFGSLQRWIDDVSKFAAPNVVKLLIGENSCTTEVSLRRSESAQ